MPPRTSKPKSPVTKPHDPPARTRAQWKARGKALKDGTYHNRWLAFWRRTVREVTKLEGKDGVDPSLIAEYVRRMRLAELHAEEAEATPYVKADSGVVRAHPGFERSLAESREARALAERLGLYVTRLPEGLPPQPPPDDDDTPEPDPEDPWVDTQTANGQAL